MLSSCEVDLLSLVPPPGDDVPNPVLWIIKRFLS